MNNDEWSATNLRLRSRIATEPDNGDAWYDYALFLRDHCSNPRLAVEAFENAKRLLPNADIRLNLGCAYADAGDFDRGIEILQACLTDKPTVHGYVLLADALSKAGRIDDGKDALSTAISLEPSFEEPYYLMGDLLRKESLERAIGYYRRAIALDPSYHLAWTQLGAALLHSPETVEEGIEALERATMLDADDGWSQMFLAIGCWKAGRVADADFHYRRAIQLFPDYPLFRQYYADFQQRQKEGEENRTGPIN